MTFPEFLVYVDQYINQVSAEWVLHPNRMPQTEGELLLRMADIQTRGIMGATGVSVQTISQFYEISNNVLMHFSRNIVDDILEFLNRHNIIHENSVEGLDTSDLIQVWELYINAYIRIHIDSATNYVLSIWDYIRTNGHSGIDI